MGSRPPEQESQQPSHATPIVSASVPMVQSQGHPRPSRALAHRDSIGTRTDGIRDGDGGPPHGPSPDPLALVGE